MSNAGRSSSSFCSFGDEEEEDSERSTWQKRFRVHVDSGVMRETIKYSGITVSVPACSVLVGLRSFTPVLSLVPPLLLRGRFLPDTSGDSSSSLFRDTELLAVPTVDTVTGVDCIHRCLASRMSVLTKVVTGSKRVGGVKSKRSLPRPVCADTPFGDPIGENVLVLVRAEGEDTVDVL